MNIRLRIVIIAPLLSLVMAWLVLCLFPSTLEDDSGDFTPAHEAPAACVPIQPPSTLGEAATLVGRAQGPGGVQAQDPTHVISVVVRSHDGSLLPGIRVLCWIVNAQGRRGAYSLGSADYAADTNESGTAQVTVGCGVAHAVQAVRADGSVSRVEQIVAPGSLEFVLHESSTVRGRVLDSGGEPVEGAKISLYPPAGCWGFGGSRPLVAGVTHTDSSGRFRLMVAESGRCRVLVGAGGGAVLDSRTVDCAGGDSDLEFHVEWESTVNLSGRILESSTEDPLAGVQIRVHPLAEVLAISDDSGRFHIEDFAPFSRGRLYFARKGLAQLSLSVAALRDRLTVRMSSATVEVRGVVVDPSGQPACGARVSLAAHAGAGTALAAFEETRTTKKGAFSFHLGQDVSRIGVTAVGREGSLMVTASLPPAEEPLDLGRLVLQNTGAVRGNIKAPKGHRAVVVLQPRGNSLGAITPDVLAHCLQKRVVFPGRDGRFVFEDLVGGAYTLGAAISGWKPVQEELQISDSDVDVHLEFPEADEVVIRFVTLDGVPLEDVSVSCNGVHVATDDTGRARLYCDVKVSDLIAFVRAPDSLRAVYSFPNSVRPKRDGSESLVKVTSLHSISGRVMDMSGQLVAGATVRVMQNEHAIREERSVDGRFLLRGLPSIDGDIFLVAEVAEALPGGYTRSWPVKVLKGQVDAVLIISARAQ